MSNKTNSTRLILIEEYKQWISDHLLKASDFALRLKVIGLFEEANVLLEKVKIGLSVQEEQFSRQPLMTREIPYPKILIKDNKTINKRGGFPTRLVIPATNSTAAFSKLLYLEIKRMLEKANANYSCVSIVQASDLKERLE